VRSEINQKKVSDRVKVKGKSCTFAFLNGEAEMLRSLEKFIEKNKE